MSRPDVLLRLGPRASGVCKPSERASKAKNVMRPSFAAFYAQYARALAKRSAAFQAARNNVHHTQIYTLRPNWAPPGAWHQVF